MTKTGIIALLIIVVALFIIGAVGFIFAKVRFSSSVTPTPLKPALVATPSPTIQEKVATPTALPSKEATPSARK